MTKLHISLSIAYDAVNNKFIATYQVVSMPFISLVVTFREQEGQLIVEDDVRYANIITRVMYQPIAERFVNDGAAAIQLFIQCL